MGLGGVGGLGQDLGLESERCAVFWTRQGGQGHAMGLLERQAGQQPGA